MRTRGSLIFGSIFLMSIAGGDARAQAVVDTAGSKVEANGKARLAIQRLSPQSHIRARSGDSVIEGRLRGISRDTLWITQFESPEAGLPLRNVDAIWTRENSIARGALGGGLLGALFLGALVGAVESSLDKAFCEPVDCTKTSGSSVAVAAAVGGFGGAVVGMLIGRNIKRWQSRYP